MPEWFEELEPCIHSSGTEPGCISCLAGRIYRAERAIDKLKSDILDASAALDIIERSGADQAINIRKVADFLRLKAE